MKTSRLIWVILANVLALLINMVVFPIVIEEHFNRIGYGPGNEPLFAGLDRYHNTYHWSYFFYLAIRTVIPIFGIYLEAVESRFAKWMNAGYFTSLVVVSYGLGLLTHEVYGCTGHCLLVPITAAGVMCFVYSKWWMPSTTSPRVLSFR